MKQALVGLIALAVGQLSAGSLPADTMYFNEATFLAAAGAVNYEDFEDETVTGTPYSSTGSTSITFSYFTATARTRIVNVFNVAQSGNANIVPVGGTKYLGVNPDFVPHAVTLQFPSPIRSLGFYYRDINETGAGKVTLSILGGSNYSLAGTGDNDTL